MPQKKTIGMSVIVYLFAAFLYAVNFGGEENRINEGGHLWLRADIIYSLASGDLPPEERQIAGLKLAYPWAFYVEQALIGYWLNSTHLSTYIWGNASWLLAVSFFAVMLVGRFGASPFTQALSLIFLYFGVNIVGYILNGIFPITLGPWESTIWGDERYTPWIEKFFNSTPMIPGLCSLFALLYTLTENRREKFDWAILLVFLLLSTGIIYPLLLPAACAFVCARIAVVFSERLFFNGENPIRPSLALFFVLIAGIGFSIFHLGYVTQDRTQGGMIHISSIFGMGRKLIEDGIVLSVLLMGCVFVFRRCWEMARPLTLFLLLGASACVLLNVVLAIPGYNNEYKYIFPAAMCLFSFPALALEHTIPKRELWAIPLVSFICLTLAFPLYCFWPSSCNSVISQPNLDVTGFNARLSDEEPLAPVVDAIRESTPSNTILVLDRWDFYWPTLTDRSMYISPSEKKYLQGTNIFTDLQLIEAGGYSKELIKRRRSVVDKLYFGPTHNERIKSLQEIRSLGRPFVIILDFEQHYEFLRWLKSNRIGTFLIDNGQSFAWLVKEQ